MKDKKIILLAALTTLAVGAVTGLAACNTDGGKTDTPAGPHVHDYTATEVLDCVRGDYTYYECSCGVNYTEASGAAPQAHTMVNDECTRCHAKATEGLEITVSGNKATVTGIGTATGDEIIIPSTYNGVPVTSIGEEAFRSNSTIKYLTLPASVTTVERMAFYDCDKIETLRLVSGLTTIGEYAFAACDLLEEANLPDTLKTLEAHSFSSCPKLNSFSIPASVESIGVGFISYDAAMQTVTVDAGNALYKVVGNCVIETRTGKLLGAGCGAKIPDDGTVTELCDYAFTTLTGLGDVVIPASVTAIGEKVFAYTDITGLTINGTITDFNVNVLSGCPSLNKLDVSGTNYKYDAVHNCIIDTGTKTLVKGCASSVIPDDGSVTAIGASAFKDCTDLTGIVIPHTVTEIGNYAFANTGLTEITLPSSLSAGVTTKMDSAFMNCRNLNTLVIEEGVKVIGQWMFHGCARLTKVVLPDSVTGIGHDAFNGCSSLSSVTLGKNLSTIGNGAFSGCNSLYECYNLSSLTVTVGNSSSTANGGLDGTVKYLHTDADEASNLIVEGEFIFADNDGVYELIGYTGSSENLVLPTSVRGSTYVIPASAFAASGYKSLTITGGVTEIGDSAFRGAKLESVYIKAGTLTIGKSAFQACSSAKTLTILADSLTLGDSYSLKMVNLTELTLSNTTLPDQSLYGSQLEKITLTNVDVGSLAFYQCTALTTLIMNGGSVGSQAFRECTALDNVTITDEVTSIGAWAFYQCGLENVVMENKEWVLSYDGQDYDFTVAEGEERQSLSDYGGYTWTKA